ncbi:MAG: MBL fold metallo-hydrolase [Clostridiales bacterium]|nr:MBL fold metallo-hydrolase [Clostridiales bacterium]
MQLIEKSQNVKIVTLYSGSGGNAVYLRINDLELLIDAGKSTRALERALVSAGSSLSNIDAIFITHEHRDHTGALEVLSKKYSIPVHMTEGSAQTLLNRSCALENNIFTHESKFSVSFGEICVRSFLTPHDSVMSVGYTIDFEEKGKCRRFGIATDMGYITEEVRDSLLGCHYVIIESNHDIAMLQNGGYPSFLKRRILSERGHLSNVECAEFLPELVASGTQKILLAHLSKENNRPDIAYECCRRSLLSHYSEQCFDLRVADSDNLTVLCG